MIGRVKRAKPSEPRPASSPVPGDRAEEGAAKLPVEPAAMMAGFPLDRKELQALREAGAARSCEDLEGRNDAPAAGRTVKHATAASASDRQE